MYYNISQNSDISVRVLDPAYISVLEGADVFLKNAAGQKVFDAYEVGRFQRRAGTFVEVDESYVGEGIQLFLKNGESAFATLKISGDFKTNITRDAGLLQNKLQSLSDTLILHLASSAYSSRELVSAANQSLLKIYYQDPFADRYALDDFHANDIQGLESSFETSGIGWQDSNTMLLSVAAGQSVGESSKRFQSFSLINL